MPESNGLFYKITASAKGVAAAAKTANKALGSIANMVKKVGTSSDKAASGMDKVKKETRKAGAEAKKSSGFFGKLATSIGRIAFYRAIRAGLKAVTQAIKEGVNNLVLYSQALGGVDSARANQTMSEFATTLLYIKNSLGAMVMPLLQALVPIVSMVADAFVAAANAVNMFFHALKGESVFTRAKKYAVDYADGLKKAGGAAKELKKQVFGFDELNIFNAPSSGGSGSGSAMDYSQMFEEAPVSDAMQRIKDLAMSGEWEAIGNIVGERMNAVVARFDATAFGEGIGTKIQAGVGVAFGFLQKANFIGVGEKVTNMVNGIVSKINWEEVGGIVALGIHKLVEFAIGAIQGLDTGTLAGAISSFFVGLFENSTNWLNSIDWVGFGKTFFQKVYDFVTGIDFGEVASSFFTMFGTALASAWEFATGAIGELFSTVSEYFHEKTDECGGNAVLGFLKGILDGLVGIATWIIDNVWTPFWSGMLEAFGIESGVSSNMSEIGEDIIDGLFDGLTKAWKAVKEWIDEKARFIKDTFKGIVGFVGGLGGGSERSLEFGANVGYYATGGQPQTGSLFWAGESGAELVGQVGGKTTVTTHDDFTSGMSDIMDNTNTVILQAAQALISAIQNKDMTAVVSVGDRQIVNAYDRGKRLAGGALVE